MPGPLQSASGSGATSGPVFGMDAGAELFLPKLPLARSSAADAPWQACARTVNGLPAPLCHRLRCQAVKVAKGVCEAVAIKLHCGSGEALVGTRPREVGILGSRYAWQEAQAPACGDVLPLHVLFGNAGRLPPRLMGLKQRAGRRGEAEEFRAPPVSEVKGRFTSPDILEHSLGILPVLSQGMPCIPA